MNCSLSESGLVKGPREGTACLLPELPSWFITPGVPGRSRPSLQDCLAHPWLQDAYLMKLRRQTLTFTTNRLKEFLGEQRRRRAEAATRHKVLLRSYPGSP